MTDDPAVSPHEAAFATTRADRDRTLDAIHRLESAAAKAAERSGWLDSVDHDLAVLEEALADEHQQSRQPDALLSLIAADNPRRFGSRIRRLRDQRQDIIRQASALRGQLGLEDQLDAGDLRHRISWVVRALHHYRALETDLVYEALELDLGAR